MALFVYNNGVKADSNGRINAGNQNQDFFLTNIARRTINQSFSFAKFASSREQMAKHSGNEFRATMYFWSIYRDVINDDGTYGGDNANAEAIENGYIAERTYKEIADKLNDMTLSNEGTANKDDIYSLGTFRKVTFKTSIKKFAGIIELTEDAESYSEDQVRVMTVEDATKQMMLAYNDLQLKDLLDSTFKVYGGDATTRSELGGEDDATAPRYSFSKKLLVNLYGALRKNKAEPVASVISGMNKIGTQPIPKSFYILVGADLSNALIDDSLFPDFVTTEKYPQQESILMMEGLEEIGYMGRFRFVYAETLVRYPHEGHKVGDGSAESETCKSSTDANGDYYYDVYPAILFSREAFATVGLQGTVPHEMYIQFPDQVDGTNPIGERGYVAWKLRYASIKTRPDNLAVIEVVCPI